ncbi:MAG TPA: DNA/RNA non-specific endonuclease [Saprospiraceae bacterium]|nr:DNA/RNA non-specific endonuclease [Saprospiraceae bacterium]
MAKLRSNYTGKSRGSGGTVVRVGIFAAVISGLIFAFNFFNGDKSAEALIDEKTVTPADLEDDRQFYLPTSTTDQIINHDYFSLSYSEAHEQAEWVAYTLTRERLDMPWHERPDAFKSDFKVAGGSATWEDYLNSGYDRGHLAPAADLAFSAKAIRESFLMSNISPQARDFNTGIWRELEENTRSWAKKYKKLYVVTGPVLSENIKGRIGDNEVSIPAYYYKVLLDVSEPGKKGIAFLLPNQISYEPLYEYAVTIDEVEERTGIDFFPNLMTRRLEEKIESEINLDLWEFSKAKHNLRTEKWNQQ